MDGVEGRDWIAMRAQQSVCCEDVLSVRREECEMLEICQGRM